MDDHFPSESGRDRCSHAFVPCTFPSSRVRTNFLRRSVGQIQDVSSVLVSQARGHVLK